MKNYNNQDFKNDWEKALFLILVIPILIAIVLSLITILLPVIWRIAEPQETLTEVYWTYKPRFISFLRTFLFTFRILSILGSLVIVSSSPITKLVRVVSIIIVCVFTTSFFVISLNSIGSEKRTWILSEDSLLGPGFETPWTHVKKIEFIYEAKFSAMKSGTKTRNSQCYVFVTDIDGNITELSAKFLGHINPGRFKASMNTWHSAILKFAPHVKLESTRKTLTIYRNESVPYERTIIIYSGDKNK